MPLGLLSVWEDGSHSYLITFQNRNLTLSRWSLGFSIQFLRNRITGPQKGHRIFCFSSIHDGGIRFSWTQCYSCGVLHEILLYLSPSSSFRGESGLTRIFQFLKGFQGKEEKGLCILIKIVNHFLGGFVCLDAILEYSHVLRQWQGMYHLSFTDIKQAHEGGVAYLRSHGYKVMSQLKPRCV